ISSHDQLAATAMPDAPGLAVGIETLLALDTEPCLGRARLVVEPGVNHLAVARAGSSADGVLGLEHQDLAAAPRQGPRDREANHSGADDDTIDFFRHRFLRMTAGRLPRQRRITIARHLSERLVDRDIE